MVLTGLSWRSAVALACGVLFCVKALASARRSPVWVENPVFTGRLGGFLSVARAVAARGIGALARSLGTEGGMQEAVRPVMGSVLQRGLIRGLILGQRAG